MIKIFNSSSNHFNNIQGNGLSEDEIYKLSTNCDKLLKKFEMTNRDLKEISHLMSEDFENGLSDDESLRCLSPVKMLLTYVMATPNGSEYGKFYAVDLGGTFLRIMVAKLNKGNIQTEHISSEITKDLMNGDGKNLFDFVALKLYDFVSTHEKKDEKSNCVSLKKIGFTFSFPVIQNSLNSGNLIRWTKGYCAKNVEGHDVVKMLRDSINQRNDLKVEDVILINDTVGTLIAGAFIHPDTTIGLIVGTGANACYIEKTEFIKKWKPLLMDNNLVSSDKMILNTEWGAFGEKGELGKWITKYDNLVDSLSINPGEQWFEKMISGLYMGEIARQIVLDMLEKKIAFNECKCNSHIVINKCFKTKHVSMIESNNNENLKEVFEDLQLELNSVNIYCIKRVCHAVSKRAAKLTSAGIYSILKRLNFKDTTIAADGTVVKKHPHFLNYMVSTLKDLVPQTKINIILSEDGSGRGAALIAAIH